MSDPSPGPPGPPMWPARGLALLAFVVLVVLVVLAGAAGTRAFLEHRSAVGTTAATEQARTTERQTAGQRTEERRAASAAREREERRYDRCVREWTPVLDDLAAVGSRLDRGTTQDAFRGLLGDASVSYEEVDVDAVSAACISTVDGPLNEALNEYIRGAGAWDDCLDEDPSCGLPDIEPTLRRTSSTASRLLDRAHERLDGLDPSTGSRS